jgi:hypothetical protein
LRWRFRVAFSIVIMLHPCHWLSGAAPVWPRPPHSEPMQRRDLPRSASRFRRSPGGTPILMRTGKRRSAETIMSRGLPGMLRSSFVLDNDGTASHPLSRHKRTIALNPPLPEAPTPRSEPRSCSTRWSVSFGTCRNRQGRSAIIGMTWRGATSPIALAMQDLGR